MTRAFLLLAATPLIAASLRVDNYSGGVTVTASMGASEIQWHASSPTREMRPEDISVTHAGVLTFVTCKAVDGARIDVQVSIPHTANLEVRTKTGPISVSGMVSTVRLVTEAGDVHLATAWELTRFRAISHTPPRELVKPKGSAATFHIGRVKNFWAYANSRPDIFKRFGDPFTTGWAAPWEVAFSAMEVVAEAVGRLELVEQPLPTDSWVRVPADAMSILNDLRKKPAAKPTAKSNPAPQTSSTEAVFRSDVRLVTLVAPIYDRAGHPVAGLKPEDFELFEDNQPQQIALVRSGETPLNLTLLLDLSKSAFLTRPLILEGTRKFIQLSQPGDRIAVHALANSLFQIVSPLTGDREPLLKLLDLTPQISGGSPIYDSIVLSYAAQPLNRPGERSAMVVLTDGMDNQFESPDHGSRIPFQRMRNAVAEWPVPIYTILVPYENPTLQEKGRRNMQQIADASAGRLFEAEAPDVLGHIYAQVAEDLRSVYSIAYYPTNQKFDGAWRGIRLKVKRPALTMRTRPGYYAW